MIVIMNKEAEIAYQEDHTDSEELDENGEEIK